MNKNIDNPKQPGENKILLEDSAFDTFKENILNKSFKVDENIPDDIAAINNAPETENEKNSIDNAAGSNSDVPGSELDDKHVAIGSENKENNYHDLGGES